MSDSSLSQAFISYKFGPFIFESEIPLIELERASGVDLHRVSIRLGATPATIEGSNVDENCTVSATEFLLNIPGVARYHVANGRQVWVDAAPGATFEQIRLYLLGSVFGALCHQNGWLPLHASAVELDGEVTAFLGHSGAGKSTLAAFLARRGHRIVSDDICLIDDHDPRVVSVIPVAGWLKLWRESLNALGEEAKEENRVLNKDDKYRVYLDKPSSDRPRIANLVFIDRTARSQPQPQVRIEEMSNSEAILGLMFLTYLSDYPKGAGAESRTFQRCGRTLTQAKAYRLVTPWGWEQIEETLSLLEARFLKKVRSV